jgi:hypothetical protein
MRVITSILVLTFLSISSHAQLSDLERSSHEYEFIGDSVELKKVLNFLQSDSIQVIAKRDQICELKIIDIGETKTLNYKIYQINYNLGISCRGVFRTIFFRDGNFIGAYNSNLTLPQKINDDVLIWKSESGDSTKMDLTNEVPKEFNFHSIKKTLIVR